MIEESNDHDEHDAYDEHDHADGHHDHSDIPSDASLRVKSLESLLVQKGIIDPAAMDAILQFLENEIGPRNGAAVVARAWSDPDFRRRLFDNATEAVRDFGFSRRAGEHLVALENSAKVHNLVVCTLCSCYPFPLLGIPPAWYKSGAYRARAVRDPRGVLREFGLELAEDVEVRVWDSNADLRYIVVPERPAGSERMTGAELAALVTRDSMVGVTTLAPVAPE